MGHVVRTLTSHPPAGAGNAAIEVHPLRFNDPAAMVDAMAGAGVLFNTYWVRFPQAGMTFEQAVENTHRLMASAKQAGVRRVVHISATNAALDSPLPYFRAKAQAEAAVVASGLSYAILRPTILYGDAGILLNNIAYFLRRMPVFPVFAGSCQLQPVFVEDLADQAVIAAGQDKDAVTDVAGPDTFEYTALLKLLRQYVGGLARLVPSPVIVSILGTRALGAALGDVILTADEVRGLRANLLISHDPPTATTHFESWLTQNAHWLGRQYMSELAKRR